MLVEMTAYCPCKKCCGKDAHGITANGTNVRVVPYNFAGDRATFSFGDEIYVPTGFGVLDKARLLNRVFVVDDRGGALDREATKSNKPRLDLRVQHHWWAKQFGRKDVMVWIRSSN